MKSSADKCYLLVSISNKVNARIDNFDTSNSKCEKLLGVKLDNKLSFDDHVSELFKNVSRKIHALTRVTPYMNISKRHILMKAIFTSKFTYYSLIWMCWSLINNRKINSLHERCLRIIYQNKQP